MTKISQDTLERVVGFRRNCLNAGKLDEAKFYKSMIDEMLEKSEVKYEVNSTNDKVVCQGKKTDSK